MSIKCKLPGSTLMCWLLLFQDKRWPCPVLDCPQSSVLIEALMPESPSKFPDNLPSPSTANPQENERVPHVQDFLSNATHLSVAEYGLLAKE